MLKCMSNSGSVAARRLEEHRKHPAGPVAALQKALWEALQRGDLTEATRHVNEIQAIRGPQPPSPMVQMLTERIIAGLRPRMLYGRRNE